MQKEFPNVCRWFDQVQHSAGDDFSESVFSSFTPRGGISAGNQDSGVKFAIEPLERFLRHPYAGCNANYDFIDLW